ncbi:MAG: hypothetical protein JW863_05200 [Chitinispirillaceae bacterium]|nr:hypothetical protein [Chitinispirillaceae bacterium]
MNLNIPAGSTIHTGRSSGKQGLATNPHRPFYYIYRIYRELRGSSIAAVFIDSTGSAAGFHNSRKRISSCLLGEAAF